MSVLVSVVPSVSTWHPDKGIVTDAGATIVAIGHPARKFASMMKIMMMKVMM